MPKRNTTPVDPVLSELTTIKRLLLFALLKTGANQREIATALGVNQSQISRMFSRTSGTARRHRK
jgi:IS30 family transposase